jgi:GTP-binding protein EngB required for normal cell division
MEPITHRSSVAQLAEDLRWLEDHCLKQSDLTAQAGVLRLASALTRNTIGPFLEGQPAKPLHICVVGGAGAGKSTVVNFLAGGIVAEANPQAGYTRHPTAFLPSSAAFPWPSFIGFLGPLQRLSTDKPANADEDVYQVKRIIPVTTPTPTENTNPLADFVIWDCPDMTTWASTGYVNRLLEVTALADVVIYVASDERYNDEVPNQFLHLIVKAGKAVIVVLTKMREADVPTLTEHFRQEILGRLPKLPDGSTPAVPILSFPDMTPSERSDPTGAGGRYRVKLVNQILIQCDSETDTRDRTVVNAARFLMTAGDGLLDVARRDLTELDAWKTLVLAGKAEFEERYRREYLSGEQFHRIDRYRDELLGLLELPGAGKLIGTFLWLARTPYRWMRDYVAGLLIRPEVLNLSEQGVLTASLSAWLDKLHSEALRRLPVHPVWKQIANRFESELAPQARERFALECRAFELKESDDLERVGKAMVERLEKTPALLYTARGGMLAFDLGVVAAIIYLTWAPSWYLLLLIPLGVSISHQGAELVVRGVVESTRRRIRHEREERLSSALTDPLAKWFSEWPASGGSSIEKLQQVLRRVPDTIRQLEQRVTNKIAEKKRDPGAALVSSAPPRSPEAA